MKSSTGFMGSFFFYIVQHISLNIDTILRLSVSPSLEFEIIFWIVPVFWACLVLNEIEVYTGGRPDWLIWRHKAPIAPNPNRSIKYVELNSVFIPSNNNN